MLLSPFISGLFFWKFWFPGYIIFGFWKMGTPFDLFCISTIFMSRHVFDLFCISTALLRLGFFDLCTSTFCQIWTSYWSRSTGRSIVGGSKYRKGRRYENGRNTERVELMRTRKMWYREFREFTRLKWRINFRKIVKFMVYVI